MQHPTYGLLVVGWLVMGWLAIGGAMRAHAQDAEDGADTAAYSARARVVAPIAATNTLDASASGTSIDLQDRPRALEDVSEALIEVPGARIRSAGGFGGFAGLSLRGAELGHTSVMLGTIPLDTPDASAFDFSMVPLAALESIEVYRGGAPLWLSEGAIGGVVRLLPQQGEQNLLRSTLGYGSFGRLELRATSSVSRMKGRRPSLFTHVDLARANNDYAYLDDGQTAFDTSDDRWLRQRNANIDAGNGMMHAGLDALGGRFEVVATGHGRTEGIPGPQSVPTKETHRQLVRTLGALSWQRERLDADGELGHRVQLLGSASHQTVRFTDLQGELGRSRSVATNDRWLRRFLRGAGSLRLLPFLETTVVGSFTRDDYHPEDALAFSTSVRSSGRSTHTLAFEQRLYGRLGSWRAEFRPSLRLQWSHTDIHARGVGHEIREANTLFAPTYRMAAVVQPLEFLSLAASAATGVRLPSIAQLFGDRVFQEANPELRPESSTTVDASVVLGGRTGMLRGTLEGRAFALWVEDLIRYERTAQFTMRPENTASARILGLELGLRGSLGRHLSLAGSLTTMDTQNQFGKQLPLRPPLQFLVRPEVSLYPTFADRITLFADAHHVSFVYLGQSNRSYVDGRTVFSVGATMFTWQDHMQLQVRARNVLDTLYFDTLSRYLPGCELLVSLTFQERVD